jgi:hypothetical protein
MQPHQMGQQPKKGLGVVGWVAIGCVGVILVVGVVAGGLFFYGARKVKAMADDPTAAIEMMAALNPDIEVVDKDTDAGTVTIRDKKSGQTMTVDMDDLKEGRINFSTSEGNEASVSFDQDAGKVEIRSEGADGAVAQFGGDTKLPAWVPSYPGATSEGVYSAQDAQSESGSFTLSSTDSLDEVFGFYRSQLQSGGYKVTENRYSSPQGDGAMLVGETADGNRTLTFTMQAAEGKVQVMGGYTQKKS